MDRLIRAVTQPTRASTTPPARNDTDSCRRADARAVVALPSTVRIANATPRDVRVDDLSPAGFSFTSAAAIPVGTILHVGLAGAGRATAQIAWSTAAHHGCIFQPALVPEQVEAAFSHVVGAAVVSLASASTEIAGDASSQTDQFPLGPHAQTRLSPAGRFALLGLTGGLCWVGLAVGLHTLH